MQLTWSGLIIIPPNYFSKKNHKKKKQEVQFLKKEVPAVNKEKTLIYCYHNISAQIELSWTQGNPRW